MSKSRKITITKNEQIQSDICGYYSYCLALSEIGCRRDKLLSRMAFT